MIKQMFCVKKGYGEVVLYKDYPFFADNDVAYRVAYYLHIMAGENLIAPLEYYKPDIKSKGYDGTRLPIAIGPRIRNWIGPYELSTAIEQAEDTLTGEKAYLTDMEIHRGAKEYSKPSGVDQLYETFWEIRSGNDETTIVIRDPEIDLNSTTLYVPNLIDITFSRHDKKLHMCANFGVHEPDDEFGAELYFLMHIRYLYEMWLGYIGIEEVRLFVKVHHAKKDFTVPIYCTDEPIIEETDPDAYWQQLRTLNNYNLYTMAFFTESTLNSSKVDVKTLWKTIKKNYFSNEKPIGSDYEPIQIPLLKDMALCLSIYGIVSYSHHNRWVKLVEEMIGMMRTNMKEEIVDYIKFKNYVM